METFLYSINSRFIQGAHFVHEVCWKYISMKQVAEIDSCISAVRRSMMAKPIRKLLGCGKSWVDRREKLQETNYWPRFSWRNYDEKDGRAGNLPFKNFSTSTCIILSCELRPVATLQTEEFEGFWPIGNNIAQLQNFADRVSLDLNLWLLWKESCRLSLDTKVF